MLCTVLVNHLLTFVSILFLGNEQTVIMPSCAAVGCNNRFYKGCGLHFYRIPKKNTVFNSNRRLLWLNALQRTKWPESVINNAKICSTHFISGNFWLPFFIAYNKVTWIKIERVCIVFFEMSDILQTILTGSSRDKGCTCSAHISNGTGDWEPVFSSCTILCSVVVQYQSFTLFNNIEGKYCMISWNISSSNISLSEF